MTPQHPPHPTPLPLQALSPNHISNTLMIANTSRKQAQGLEKKERRQIEETVSSQILLRSGKELNSANISRSCILWYASQEASSVLKVPGLSISCTFSNPLQTLGTRGLHGPSFVSQNWLEFRTLGYIHTTSTWLICGLLQCPSS